MPGYALAVHGLHHGQRRPAGHQQLPRRVPEPGRHLSARRAGQRSSPTPASSSARPTCSTSTGASASARSATPDAAAMPDLVGARMVAAGADRRSRVFWMGIYPESFLRPIAQRRRPPARPDGARRARRGFAPDARQGRRCTWITERRTDGPLRAAPAGADPVDRRHDPDDGRGVHRAARLGAWSAGSRSRCCLSRPSR